VRMPMRMQCNAVQLPGPLRAALRATARPAAEVAGPKAVRHGTREMAVTCQSPVVSGQCSTVRGPWSVPVVRGRWSVVGPLSSPLDCLSNWREPTRFHVLGGHAMRHGMSSMVMGHRP
jgi:hypothetical protein